MVIVDKKIPNFSALLHDGNSFQLSAFLDKPVVMYFYPRDDTPGCTQEACDFRDSWATLKRYCNLVGVSRDSASSHQKFIDKYNLPFVLVSDSNEELCSLFEVMKDKNMYGKKVRVIERSTFLIDVNFTLVREWRKVKIEGHVDEVIAAAKDLN